MDIEEVLWKSRVSFKTKQVKPIRDHDVPMTPPSSRKLANENFQVKLAAALARLRIKNNALRLNQLLPNHLRDENLISLEDTPVTGWVNTFKTE